MPSPAIQQSSTALQRRPSQSERSFQLRGKGFKVGSKAEPVAGKKIIAQHRDASVLLKDSALSGVAGAKRKIEQLWNASNATQQNFKAFDEIPYEDLVKTLEQLQADGAKWAEIFLNEYDLYIDIAGEALLRKLKVKLE